MKVRQIMTGSAVSVGAGENVEVAARTLHRYNIGALPVCGADGKVCGMVTDRDLVMRCVAAGKLPNQTQVRDVMTRQVISVTPETSVEEARSLMAQGQIRRLPVTENGRLCGILSLGDLATHGAEGQILAQISAHDL
ncbi:MAG: CBS domain-containing protein [Ruminococcaceae bacterium]|nr:CBS domain-containing protein [Oscillospiraceae bacterium]